MLLITYNIYSATINHTTYKSSLIANTINILGNSNTIEQLNNNLTKLSELDPSLTLTIDNKGLDIILSYLNHKFASEFEQDIKNEREKTDKSSYDSIKTGNLYTKYIEPLIFISKNLKLKAILNLFKNSGINTNIDMNSLHDKYDMINPRKHIRRDFNQIIFLLKLGFANFRNNNGDTPITAIFTIGLFLKDLSLEIAKLSIAHGADINVRNNKGETALMWAIRLRYLEIVKLLLDNGANINTQDNNGGTALMQSSERDNIEIAKMLLEKNLDINTANINGDTALMLAAKNGQKDTVKLLLDNGANINNKNKDGYNALMLAYIHQYTKVRGYIDTIFLNPGARNIVKYKPNETEDNRFIRISKELNDIGATNFSETINTFIESYKNIIQLLIDAGANPGTDLIYESMNGRKYIVELLISNKTDINTRDEEGNTPLISACKYNNIEIALILLNEGAKLNIQNIFGDTALIFASMWGYKDLVKLLINHRANIDIQNNEGETALITATKHGRTDIVQLLINRGANINIKDAYGNNALSWASKFGHATIWQLLKQKTI